MPTIALEGVGATIEFATSGFTGDLITLTLPEYTREIIDTTHLGSTAVKSSKPGGLCLVGEISAKFGHTPNEINLVKEDPELITITYPLMPGEEEPKQLIFMGYIIAQGGQVKASGQRMVTNVTIMPAGDDTEPEPVPDPIQVYFLTGGPVTVVLGLGTRYSSDYQLVNAPPP